MLTASLRRNARAGRAAILTLAILGAFGCGGGGHYVWYTALPPSEWGAESPEYMIGAGDSISIKVYEQEGLSGAIKVRSDGRIAIPLVGEVVAAGKHPSALSRELEGLLRKFIVTPRVTINVEQSQPVAVTVLGEVKTSGTIVLDSPPRLLQAIAKAGGLSEFASDSHVFLLRPYPSFRRIRFTYRAIVDNENGAASFLLRAGDVIVVE